MKNLRKAICLILSLMLLLSAFSAVTFAQEESLKFVLLGDSIAHGTGLEDKANNYGSLVSNTNGYTYENYAIPGHRTQDLLRRLGKDSVSAAVKDADIIGVSIGGNNFLYGGVLQMVTEWLVLDSQNKIDKNIEKLKKEFIECILKIRELNSDAVILVQTLYNPATGLPEKIYQYAVDELNGAIRQAQTELEGTFYIVDVAEAFKGHAKEYIQFDVTHPNEKGHYVIAEEYLKVLCDLGLGEKTEPDTTLDEILNFNMFDKIWGIFKDLFTTIEAWFK